MGFVHLYTRGHRYQFIIGLYVASLFSEGKRHGLNNRSLEEVIETSSLVGSQSLLYLITIFKKNRDGLNGKEPFYFIFNLFCSQTIEYWQVVC